jgi:hypothetical protein
MLWKIGFDIPRYAEGYALLCKRLEAFNRALLAVGGLKQEEDREELRSVGVNLFVSVEEFLDKLVSFNVWLLASDHFLVSRFRYELNVARQKVSEILGRSIGEDDTRVQWNTHGENSLGTLLCYLREASAWIGPE